MHYVNTLAVLFSETALTFDFGLESKLHISQLELGHGGLYECANGFESVQGKRNNRVLVVPVRDCRWGDWSPWSECSKTCAVEEAGAVSPGEDWRKMRTVPRLYYVNAIISAGVSTRHRAQVAEALNGGEECRPEDATEQRACPRIGEEEESGFVLCPGKQRALKVSLCSRRRYMYVHTVICICIPMYYTVDCQWGSWSAWGSCHPHCRRTSSEVSK